MIVTNYLRLLRLFCCKFKACAQRTSLTSASTCTEVLILRHLLQSLVSQVGFSLSGTVNTTTETSSTNEGQAEGKKEKHDVLIRTIGGPGNDSC